MNLQRAILRDGPAPSQLKMAIAQMGAIEIELIQVLGGGEFYTEFLRNQGEGLHHLGSYIDDYGRYDRRLAELVNQGIKPTFQYHGRSLGFAYLDTQAIGGVIFELIHLDRRKSIIKRLFSKEILERGEAPLRNSLPSPLMKGRGIKGEGLPNKNLKGEGLVNNL